MYRAVIFEDEETYINDFLALPPKLYLPDNLTQNEAEERKLLLNNHVLSKYFTLKKLLIYDDTGQVSARCIMTIYENDPVLYMGFFECINNKACAEVLFCQVNSFAKANHYEKIIGPVDASFWLKYRMKINLFDKAPYASEPYNKDYYQELFMDNGYMVCQRYVSNIYKKLPLFYGKKGKYERRFREFTDKNYKIVSPKKKDFDKVISQIYHMLMELYSDFPVFKPITEADFQAHFHYFKGIMDMSMVKTAYYNGEMTGFFIGIPDYETSLYGKVNLLTPIKVLLKRVRSANYVMLYMGVKKEHKGLGKAMIRPIIRNIYFKRATAIGALIQEGKPTEHYVEDSIHSKYKYVLLEKNVQLEDSSLVRELSL